MPELLPFAGLRPDPSVAGRLDDVVCPPYDVITEEERQALFGRSPYNVVRVELPNGDYVEAAGCSSSGAPAEHWHARRPRPVRLPHELQRARWAGTRQTLGVIGALVLEPPGRGILPHEQTTPKAKSDRLELHARHPGNTSPIWCLCSQPGLAHALGGRPGGPDRHAAAAGPAPADDDGDLHEIWPTSRRRSPPARWRVVWRPARCW